MGVTGMTTPRILKKICLGSWGEVNDNRVIGLFPGPGWRGGRGGGRGGDPFCIHLRFCRSPRCCWWRIDFHENRMSMDSREQMAPLWLQSLDGWPSQALGRAVHGSSSRPCRVCGDPSPSAYSMPGYPPSKSYSCCDPSSSHNGGPEKCTG